MTFAAAALPRMWIGIWIVESRYREGMLVNTVEFSDGKDGICGRWHEALHRDGALAEFKVRGIKHEKETVSFEVKIGDGPEWWWTMLWAGRFTSDDRLEMQWITPDGHVVRNRFFRKVTPAELTDIKATAPQIINRKLPLPAVRELPFNGLALTPPMGWSSWNYFKESADDKTLRQIADAMVTSGLREAGYVYVNIDDGWQGQRDATGVLHPNSKFPDMKALADYVHSKDLKLGIYSSPGPVTCCGYLGSHGYEIQDAQTFAEWGIDLIRYDWCSAHFLYKTQPEMQAVYQKMGAALQATGRPIVYTLCQYGMFDVSRWGRQVGGNMWRTGGDMVEGQRWATMSERFEANGHSDDQRPGGWNDPDHMVIGLDGMSEEEQRTHMTLWAIQSAPLLLGNDIRAMSANIKRIVSNKEVIAIDQDALGKQGVCVIRKDAKEAWVKPLADGSSAIALFNRGTTEATVTVSWVELGVKNPRRVRDLWNQTDLDAHPRGVQALIPSHGSALLRVE